MPQSRINITPQTQPSIQGVGWTEGQSYLQLCLQTFWLWWLFSVAMAALPHTSWTGGEKHTLQNIHVCVSLYSSPNWIFHLITLIINTSLLRGELCKLSHYCQSLTPDCETHLTVTALPAMLPVNLMRGAKRHWQLVVSKLELFTMSELRFALTPGCRRDQNREWKHCTVQMTPNTRTNRAQAEHKECSGRLFWNEKKSNLNRRVRLALI